MQDAKLFSTRLTFSSTTSILFAFYLFLLSFSHEMSRFLRFFLYPYAFSFLQALEILDGRLTWREARPLIFHAKHGYSGSHGKTPHPLFDSLPFAFS
jgi:hypothetical protein